MATYKFVYYLVLHNEDHKRPLRGWQVRVKRKLRGKKYEISKYYAFVKHGGKHAALRKALYWRSRNIPREWL